jgi:hypothetical protein
MQSPGHDPRGSGAKVDSVAAMGIHRIADWIKRLYSSITAMVTLSMAVDFSGNRQSTGTVALE